jgi:hypothetical protein
MISEPMVRSAPTMKLSCTDTNTISKQTKTRFHMPMSLEVALGVSERISEAMVRLAQTVHLSCTDTNTITKQTEMRFHMADVT